MESLTNILSKKISQPRFRQALEFTHIKKLIEEFFLDQGLRLRVLAFEKKEQSVTIKTFHPAQSREILNYQHSLNTFLATKNLPLVKKIIIQRSRY